jgi:hypothetical protein
LKLPGLQNQRNTWKIEGFCDKKEEFANRPLSVACDVRFHLDANGVVAPQPEKKRRRRLDSGKTTARHEV